MPPIPPSGPTTAPEKSDASGATIEIGNRRQSIFVGSPSMLSRADPLMLFGAFAYLASRPTSNENGMQMAGKSQGFPPTTALSHRSLLPSV